MFDISRDGFGVGFVFLLCSGENVVRFCFPLIVCPENFHVRNVLVPRLLVF